MKLIPIKAAPKEFKEAVLHELGYGSDGKYVLESNGDKHVDPYSNVPVTLDNMIIMPGSVLVLDDNALSIASYIEEHGDIL
ncbi:MAG TPA: hypothetical protein VK424_07335 [Thermoplasmata archaeon]|nr:hypothetical protein [Thermoplasmata archaeon]